MYKPFTHWVFADFNRFYPFVFFQSSVLELADIFGPAPVTSTHTSADPWDIPGGGYPRSVEVWNHDTTFSPAFSPPTLSLSSSWEHNSKELCSCSLLFLFFFLCPIPFMLLTLLGRTNMVTKVNLVFVHCAVLPSAALSRFRNVA